MQFNFFSSFKWSRLFLKNLYSNQLKSAKNNSKLSLKGTDTQYSGFIDNNDNKSVDFASFTDIYT